MKKPNDYDSVNVGDFTPVELGGHLAVVKQVNQKMSKTNKPMYVVLFDFAPGDTQAGYFMDMYKNDNRAEKKYPNQATRYILAFDADGNTNRSLKRFITSVESSNTGFTCNWTEDEEAFCKQFKDKKVGVVFGSQKDFYNGKELTKRVMRWFCDINKVSEQGVPDEVETQAYKDYKNSAQSYFNNAPKDADGFMDIPDGIDEELPFN